MLYFHGGLDFIFHAVVLNTSKRLETSSYNLLVSFLSSDMIQFFSHQSCLHNKYVAHANVTNFYCMILSYWPCVDFIRCYLSLHIFVNLKNILLSEMLFHCIGMTRINVSVLLRNACNLMQWFWTLQTLVISLVTMLSELDLGCL